MLLMKVSLYILCISRNVMEHLKFFIWAIFGHIRQIRADIVLTLSTLCNHVVIFIHIIPSQDIAARCSGKLKERKQYLFRTTENQYCVQLLSALSLSSSSVVWNVDMKLVPGS